MRIPAIAATCLLTWALSTAGAQSPAAPASSGQAVARTEAARQLLEDGVDGLAAVLAEFGVPPLTFDQEAQIRLLHDTYVRQRNALLEEGDRDPAVVDESLAEQLLLAAARFLNPVQRDALGGFVDAEINADLPQDEAELREYLRDLTNPLSGRDRDFVIDGFQGGRMPTRDEILEIRINDNAFTAEQSSPGRGRTQIITRGGTGDFNGDFTFDFQDEALDARNAFADSRPPYQTREFELNLSAPVIPDRLTLTGSFRSDVSEEGDTLRAETLSGLISEAITRPRNGSSFTTRATAQLNDDHALTLSFSHEAEKEQNQGVGGFDLPEQGSTGEGSGYNFQVMETAVLTPSLSNEIRFRVQGESEESVPLTSAPRIDVRGAFAGGGSTDRGTSSDTDLEFGDLLMFTGEDVSIKTGFDGEYARERSESYENFNGTFTFSSLEDYAAGRPIRYSVNQGDPALDVRQFQAAGYVQSDFRLTSRLTMGLGVRFEAQSNLSDWNNIDPRLGFAYQLAGTTVVRGGSGIFHDRVPLWTLQEVFRFDGDRQQTLIIRNPSYPDPFQSGDQTLSVPSSVRVRSDALAAPYSWHNELSLETTLGFGLQITGAYRFVRGVHLLRSRNLNAPLDVTAGTAASCRPEQPAAACVRPQPDRGDILQLESTGTSRDHEFRLGFQQRLSFLNVRGNYTVRSAYSDATGGFGQPADNYDLALEWGPEASRHRADVSVNFRLPWNVDTNAVFEWSSGEPYSLETGRDDNRDSNTDDRPPGVHRNSLTGPSTFGLDLDLSKTFILIPEAGGEGLNPAGGGGYFGRRSGLRMTIEARANNVLNQTVPSRVSGIITSPFFGEAIRVRDARQIALSARFDF